MTLSEDFLRPVSGYFLTACMGGQAEDFLTGPNLELSKR